MIDPNKRSKAFFVYFAVAGVSLRPARCITSFCVRTVRLSAGCRVPAFSFLTFSCEARSQDRSVREADPAFKR